MNSRVDGEIEEENEILNILRKAFEGIGFNSNDQLAEDEEEVHSV